MSGLYKFVYKGHYTFKNIYNNKSNEISYFSFRRVQHSLPLVNLNAINFVVSRTMNAQRNIGVPER